MKPTRTLVACFGACSFALLLGTSRASADDAVLENDRLKVTFSEDDGSLDVLLKETGDVWTAASANEPFQVTSTTPSATTLLATLTSGDKTLDVTLALTPGADELTAQIEVQGKSNDGTAYDDLPAYPYPFTMSDGYYVQNTSGDGALFDLTETSTIKHMYDFIGIPWWGLTDFKKGMMGILDTPYRPGDSDSQLSACELPVKLRYVFFPKAGYVEMARHYRDDFLGRYPGLKEDTLRQRATKPGVSNLKDGAYIYFWEGAQDGDFMKEVHDAGITHAIATLYYGGTTLGQDQLVTLYQKVKSTGWTAGMYTDPGGNLTHVATGSHWVNDVLVGGDPVAFYAAHTTGWDHICSQDKADQGQTAQFQALAGSLGLELMYFDTYVVNFAPCLDATHPHHNPLLPYPNPLPSPYATEQSYRIDFIDALRNATSAVGSGEGLAPAWAISHLDFFEGSMMLRTYGENTQPIPDGGYNNDFAPASGPPPPGLNVDETHRIPLLELMFHDHVASTWDWRDTNFQYLGTSAKKDLFNALYGTMPMWNMTTQQWSDHRQQYLDSYAFLSRSRSLVGFDDMIGHGYLSDDREVQYTDWASGLRIIANFDDSPRTVDGQTVGALDFVVVEANEGRGGAGGGGAGGGRSGDPAGPGGSAPAAAGPASRGCACRSSASDAGGGAPSGIAWALLGALVARKRYRPSS